MNTKLMTIFTRTPLHVGCGSSVGAVDQPVVRERHTRFPIIPGSAIKGVLADLWMEVGVDVEEKVKENKDGSKTKSYVRIKGSEAYQILGNNADGKDDKASAGALLVGEGRILLFPVRSAKKCWAWLTCPLALERFAYDNGVKPLELAKINNDEAIASGDLIVKGSDSAVFEDYPFTCKDGVDKVVEFLKDMTAGTDVLSGNLADHLAVVTDELFTYFVSNACEIANHNRISDETGVVEGGALFSQENVPSETLFYSVLGADKPYSPSGKPIDVLAAVEGKLKDFGNLMQIGADATTGLGWCSVALKDKKGVK
jgi:CRISPR-associated protein Cmr4